MAELRYPDDLRYTKDHEWAKEVGGLVTVGITDFAQDALGDIVYLELPEVGKELKAGDPFGVVESTKSVSELFAPVTGTVVERNDALVGSPETLNQDPYGKGWLVKVKPSDAGAVGQLLDKAAYLKTLAEQGS